MLLALGLACALTAPAFASDKDQAEPLMQMVGRETKKPNFLVRLDAEERFERCVTAAFQAGGIDEDEAFEAVIAKGKVGSLYADLQKDWMPRALQQMGIDPHGGADDRAKLKAVTAAIARPVDDPAFAMTGPRLSARLRIAQLDGLGLSSCDVPAHLLPGGDPERDWMMANDELVAEMMEAGATFAGCVDEKLTDDDSPDVGALHDAIPADAQASIRAHVISSLSADKLLQRGDREKIESAETIDDVLLLYKLLMGATMDMRLIGKMVLYDKYYQNRYLNLGCDFNPSPRLREHLGIHDDR